jgi:YgiT-type zinc finger domain-containing protein
MECLHCKGALVRGTAPFTVQRSDYQLRWIAVPAWRCVQCGEPVFEGQVVRILQATISAVDQATDKLMGDA